MGRAVDEFEAAAKLRRWTEVRTRDDKIARKRAHTLFDGLGWHRLGKSARRDANDLLSAVGLQSEPSVLECDRDDQLQLTVVGGPIESAALPTQLIAYYPHNWTGESMGHGGQWLRCLKATNGGDRQLIWSEDAIAGIVTFSSWLSDAYTGAYERWGSIERFPEGLGRADLLNDRRTKKRFDANGIKALQGNSISLDKGVAEAISDLVNLPPTPIPLGEPDYEEKRILWTGLQGIVPEAVIEAEVASTKSLWRRLGFPHAPRRQRHLGAAGRVDLIAGDVVGEAKRAVTLRDGPDQIERYLLHLEDAEKRDRSKTKGVLLQCALRANESVVSRVEKSDFQLELWSVFSSEKSGRWKLERLA